MNAPIQLEGTIGHVAHALLGKPNAGLSTAAELRFGTRGSMAVNLVTDVWHDHEQGCGGGVLDLIARETGITARAGQYAWLEKHCSKHMLRTRSPECPEVLPKPKPKPKIVETYPYQDEEGATLFEVVRRDPKDFRQRKPNGAGGWSWAVKGVRQIPFRLPQLLKSMPDQPIFVAEGEKDVLRLESLGLVATCNAGGAGKWPDTLSEFFRNRRVIVLPDNDEPGQKHAEIVSAALAQIADVKVLQLPDLPPKGDVSDWIDAGGSADKLLELVAAIQPVTERNYKTTKRAQPTLVNDKDDEDTKQSQASLLVKFVEQRFELFHDINKEVFARDAKTGEVRNITSRQFRDCLLAGFYTETDKAPREQAVREALSTLSGLGRFQGKCLSVSLRTAGAAGHYFLDLAIPGTSKAVNITPGSWQVVDAPDAMFVRPESMQPLPEPVTGGSLEALWKVANVQPSNQLLALAWLVECLRPDTPFPIAELLGEQGSGKSGTQTALRRLFDPNACDLRGAPRSVEDIYVSASACCVLSYENVSHLPGLMQDALCVLATGGGHAKRKLYSDNDESIVNVKRPIILNGISACVTAQDLVDRTVTIETPVIADRLETTELWREYEAQRPRLLGALLDIAAKALLLLPTMSLPAENRPRLLEFAYLGMAVAVATGKRPEDFMRQFNASRQESLSRTIDASPVASAVVDLIEARPEGVTDTAKHLLQILEQYRANGCDSWPKSPKGLGDALRRAAPALRQLGIECKGLPKQGGTVKWELKKKIGKQSPASPDPFVLPNGSKEQDFRTFRTSSREVCFDDHDAEEI
ncbi:toprim domain-containing protein [Stutzerimonas kunmingensis]|uniref:toprim domain-containing protein n=1 Tax=Stutzerimonas kunmingensis TaxID=1211807 RepID=UPI0028A78470|nr:toprim domain-containing protein [Stutzerimonas kunmingensis]